MSTVTTKRAASGDVYYVDTSVHSRRVLDALGPNVVKFITDFMDLPVDATSGEYDPNFVITRTEAGAGESTFGPADGSAGIGRIATDANENDGVSAQLRSESFKLATGNLVYFGIRLRPDEATQSDFWVGLCIRDTDPLGGNTDSVGFRKVDGSTSIAAFVNKNSVETALAGVGVAGVTWMILEFFYDGPTDTIYFYVDGAFVGSLVANANIPDDEELTVTVQFLAGSAGVKTLDLDFIRAIQLGRS